MMKLFYFSFLILISIVVHGQERLLRFENTLKTSTSNITGVVPIVNEKNNDIGFFVLDTKHIYGYKISSNFEVLDKIKFKNKRRAYKIIVGTSITDNNSYRVFLSNKSNAKFGFIDFSFNTGESTIKEFTIDKDERFLQTVSQNNKFYLLTRHKDDSILFVYTFDSGSNMIKNTIDLNKINFADRQGNPTTLSYLLVFDKDIPKIKSNTPNSIDITSSKIKLFQNESTVFLTIDKNLKFTQVIEINLNSLEANGKFFKKPTLTKAIERSNSFFSDGHLFTISASNKDFKIEIINYDSLKKVEELYANKESDIAFKNSPIIQENGFYTDYRELNKTQKFLRRLSTEEIGISVRRHNDTYKMIIGSIEELNYSGMMSMSGFGAMQIASVGNFSLWFNPTFMAYNSFSKTKATRIESILDINFQHRKGEIPNNVFDTIKKYQQGQKNAGYTIFDYKDFIIATDYNTDTNNFRFLKYSD